jgi:hypothetical protein
MGAAQAQNLGDLHAEAKSPGGLETEAGSLGDLHAEAGSPGGLGTEAGSPRALVAEVASPGDLEVAAERCDGLHGAENSDSMAVVSAGAKARNRLEGE